MKIALIVTGIIIAILSFLVFWPSIIWWGAVFAFIIYTEKKNKENKK